MLVQSLHQEDPLKKEMATQSSIHAWKIPWTEERDAGYCPWGRKESGTTERLHFTSHSHSDHMAEHRTPIHLVKLGPQILQ